MEGHIKHHTVAGTLWTQTENPLTVTVGVSRVCSGDNRADADLVVSVKVVVGTDAV